MKNLFGVLILLSITLIGFSSNSAHAQHVNKGAMMLGGGLSFTSVENENAKNSTSLTVAPGFAYFVANNFALGLEVEYTRNKSPNFTTTRLGLGPLARGYITGGLFGQAQYMWGERKVDYTSSQSKTSGSRFILGAGYTVFLNNSIALEPMLFYSFESDDNVFGLRVGIQAFLGRHSL